MWINKTNKRFFPLQCCSWWDFSRDRHELPIWQIMPIQLIQSPVPHPPLAVGPLTGSTQRRQGREGGVLLLNECLLECAGHQTTDQLCSCQPNQAESPKWQLLLISRFHLPPGNQRKHSDYLSFLEVCYEIWQSQGCPTNVHFKEQVFLKKGSGM